MSNGTFSFKKRLQIYQKTNGHCSYCGIQLPIDNWAVEHMNPKLQNGSNEIDNLTPSCHTCNSKKNHKNVDEFRKQLTAKAIADITQIISNIKRYGISSQERETITILEQSISLLNGNNFKFFFDNTEVIK